MRWLIAGFGVLILAAVAGLAAAVGFSRPQTPPVLASIADPFRQADYSDLPPLKTYQARDGTALSYYAYPGEGREVAVLVHGSSAPASSMHLLARALNESGVTVYALSMRGHPGSGRPGDIDYVGQLDDDIGDFMKMLGPRLGEERRTLAGFSSGGAFAMRIAGNAYGPLFDRFVFISPALPRTPTMRERAGGWAGLALPRLIAIGMIERLGVHAFGGLPVVAFAVAPDMAQLQTPVYSYRLLTNFGPSDDIAADLKTAQRPMEVLVGAEDEVLVPERLRDVFVKVRPDIPVTLVPGVNHAGMITSPEGVSAVTALFR